MMLRTAGAGLTTPAVAGRGLSEGLGITATWLLCIELKSYVVQERRELAAKPNDGCVVNRGDAFVED
jgi:hypothetical protein